MIRRRGFLQGLLAAVPVGVAAAITRGKATRPDPRMNPGMFRLDLEQYHHVDPALLGYREAPPLAEGLEGASAMTLAPDGAAFISIGRRILLLADGRTVTLAETKGRVTALTAWEEKSLWVASGSFLRKYGRGGRQVMEPVWLGEKGYITSIASDGERLFAADAGQKLVWIVSFDGKLLGQIDGRRGDRSGFVVPSPWFCLAAGPDGLWVVNPGRQRVERYASGSLTGSWGHAAMSIEGFCGCCNPTHLALLPDGGFVTSEKGIPRVKEYDSEGSLLSVVAGAEAFDEGTAGLALAVEPGGRVLVLDPVRGQLRAFTKGAGTQKA